MGFLKSAAAFMLLAIGISGCQTTTNTTSRFSTDAAPRNTVTVEAWIAQSGMPTIDDQAMDAPEVAYILRKTGFEPSPDEVSVWIGRSRNVLIEHLLSGLDTTPRVPVPEWVSSSPRYWGHRDWPEPRRNAFRAARNQEIGEMRHWWIKQMLATRSPFAERMVLFWENTFVAGYSGLDNVSHAQWMHHQTIRRHALGSYRDLVLAMLKDPAVLIYLDNNRNKKDSPNENLARELFELYTLGESNYTERDIKEAARTLAGWHVSDFGDIAFQEKAWARDYGSKTIFDRSGRFDGEDLVDIILGHPAAAEHVARRLWLEFVSAEPMPAEALAQWSDGFRRTGYDISALLEIILRSAYFWDPRYRATSVKSPVELAIGALRASRNNQIPLSVVDATLSDMGQTLFDPPDVSGWGYGDYWLDPAMLIERERFQASFAEVLDGARQDMRREVMTSGAGDSVMPGGKILKVKLAGEAYRGPPRYRIRMRHAGGIWISDARNLESARDTERLGRYEDASQWIWETVSFAVPNDVRDVESIDVWFVQDAAGNGGDRNLFVGAVEWDGTALPASLGTQSPGCGTDQSGKQRHPDRLYCAGWLELPWKTLAAAMDEAGDLGVSRNDLETRELVLLWLKPPSEGGWQGVDLMFDGLSFRGRTWDHYGFKVAIDTRRGWYQLSIDEDRCQPACVERWPHRTYRDEAGVRHLSIYFNNYEDWAREQYYGLTSADKELVAALVSLMPKVRDLVAETEAHREPDSREIWLERMETFIGYSEDGRWRLDRPVTLVETNAGSEIAVGMGGMSMMAIGAMGSDADYALFADTFPSADAWHKALETKLQIASEPMEAWMLSAYEGPRLTDIQSVMTSPYLNLK